VRTIFLTGFPDDLKEREVNNLLRFLPGYEASQMHFKNNQAQAFALFNNGGAARAAVGQLHNLVFDGEISLRCEVARKNMYLKDDHTSKRGRFEGGTAPGGHSYGAPAAADPYAAAPVAAAAPSGPRQYAPVTNTKDNPPCNTLFIGNLGDVVSEAELRGVFAGLPGFRQLKLIRGARSVTCFVEFADLPSAMACHNNQQGLVLQSSDRGGMRIQYSKNPFGKKRDSDGSLISTPPAGYGAPQSYDQAAYGAAAAPAAAPAAYPPANYAAGPQPATAAAPGVQANGA
jgi:hypothetical protein